MSNINVGVLLKLSDQFSPQLNKALSSSKNFANGFNGAMCKVDGALNSMTGKLAMLGVSIGAAATVNKMIAFEDRINKIGTIVKSTAKDTEEYKKIMNGLGNEIYRVATLPSVKMDANELLASMKAIAKATGDLDFAKENLENIGVAMSGFGASGEDMGKMFSEFRKLKLSSSEISKLMDEMYAQGNKGAFTADQFAKYGSQIIAAYSPIGSSANDIKNANAAMQILMMGIGEEAQSVTALKTLMSELGDTKRQDTLAKYGIEIRDTNGQMRDLNDIMLDIAKVEKGLHGKAKDGFLGIFGGVAKQAVQAYSQYGENVEGLVNLGDVYGQTVEAGTKNSESLAKNLKNLQTAFDGFANSNIAPLLAEVTKHLNWFASDPKRFDKLFKTLSIGFGVVFGAKAIFGITQFASQLRGITSMGGKGLSMPGMGASPLGNTSGATPVFVVNMGAGMTGGSQGFDNTPLNPNMNKGKNGLDKISKLGKLSKFAKIGGGAALFSAIRNVPQAMDDWKNINANEELDEKGKKKAKGGVVGETAGKVGGAAVGAIVGGALGSVIPVFGTAIGTMLGSSIGELIGGKIGNAVGSHIGESLTKDDTLANKEAIPPIENTATLKGNAELDVAVSILDNRITAQVTSKKKDMDYMDFNTGSYSTMSRSGVY